MAEQLTATNTPEITEEHQLTVLHPAATGLNETTKLVFD
jgi:hypothetical protein